MTAEPCFQGISHRALGTAPVAMPVTAFQLYHRRKGNARDIYIILPYFQLMKISPTMQMPTPTSLFQLRGSL